MNSSTDCNNTVIINIIISEWATQSNYLISRMDNSVYRRIDDLKLIIGDINQSQSHLNEKLLAFKRFAGIAGIETTEDGADKILESDWEAVDNEGTIDVMAFRADMIQRGLDSHWADATFKAFDINKDGGINKYEYFLGVLAATKSTQLDSFVDPKWMSFRSKLLFYFFCRLDGRLGRVELERMAHDCHIVIDVDRIAPPAPTDDGNDEKEGSYGDSSSSNTLFPWSCTLKEFINLVLDHKLDVIHALNVCSTRRPHLRTYSQRVTLDSRLITTENTAVTLKTHVSTTMPTMAKAPGLVVVSELAPTYEWPQNLLYDRTTAAHKIATFMLQQTIGLVHLQLSSESIDSPSKFSVKCFTSVLWASCF